MKHTFTVIAAAAALAACSQSPAPIPATSDVAPPPTLTIDAPAGRYALDPNHANLSFSLKHVGLSNYVMRFTKYTVALDLDPVDPTASSVLVEIDPTSVSTDFSGDYRGSHPQSPYQSWHEALAQSPEFLNAGAYPKITFRSTAIERTADGGLRITGDLDLLGQSHPVTLDAQLVGAMATHPFTGKGAMGFAARGSFRRSQFGMNAYLEPPVLGDEITLSFDGELHEQAKESAPG